MNKLLKKLTHMHGAWENLAFSENGESVVEVGNVVLCYIFVRENRLVTLQTLEVESLTASITAGSYFAVR